MSKIAADSVEEIVLQIVEDRQPQTVSQLVSLVREQLQISEEQALGWIMDLQTSGKIRFASQPLSSSSKLSSYLKTHQASWYWITTIFASLTLVCVFVFPGDLQVFGYVQNVLGIIFVVYLPGYTFVKALFPVEVPIKTSEENFDKIERFVLSVSMSLVVIPIVGLLLNFTPWGIGLVPMTFTLFAFSMFFSAIALVRERQAKMKTPIL